jgi:hypothetical protein
MLLRQILFEKLFATPAGTEFDLRNTLFFKILRANPLLARFYADYFRRHGANPSLIKDLETLSEKFLLNQDQSTKRTTKSSKGTHMAIHPNARACTHIKVNGHRCGSPSLRGEVFCYFHQRMIRGVRIPPKSRIHPMAMLEDQESIQASLMEIINALVRNQIDVARARLVLRALAIAARHANRAHFGWSKEDMVKEIPEYPAAPPSTGPFGIAAEQAVALTTVGVPQKEESETERLSNSALRRYEEQILKEERNRKPPASVRRSRPRRTATRARSG